MNTYLIAVLALLLAAIAQSSIAWAATELFMRKGQCGRHRRSWLAIALGASMLALQHGYTLEFALQTGIYDLRQALLAAFVSLLFAIGTHGLKR